MISFIKGLSSFLFIIPTYKAFITSNNLLWKLSNLGLIFASYFYNSSNNNLSYLFMDHLMICCCCLSYINQLSVTQIIVSHSLLEWNKTNSIENSKNLSLFFVICKSCLKTYTYLHINYFYTISTCFLLATIIYFVRKYLYYYRNISLINYILLTYMLHICISTTLYISNMTA
jgi:hypothetical protein